MKRGGGGGGGFNPPVSAPGCTVQGSISRVARLYVGMWHDLMWHGLMGTWSYVSMALWEHGLM